METHESLKCARKTSKFDSFIIRKVGQKKKKSIWKRGKEDTSLP